MHLNLEIKSIFYNLIRFLSIFSYRHKPNIRSSNSDQFMSDTENIHLACLTKYETYDSLLIIENSDNKYSQII